MSRLVLTKRTNYLAFWLIVGVALFLLQESVARLSGDEQLMTLRLLISTYVSVAAILVIRLKNFFVKIVPKLSTLVELPMSDVSWKTEKIAALGSLGTFTKRAFATLVVFGFTGTVLWLGLPYQSRASNLTLIICLQPFLLVSAHLICGIVGLMANLKWLHCPSDRHLICPNIWQC